MSTQRSDASDLIGLATSIREQIAESQHALPVKGGRKSPYLIQLNDLQDQVATLLDLLDSASPDEPRKELYHSLQKFPGEATATSYSLHSASSALHSLTETAQQSLAETLDRHLARWQAQVMLAYSQGASQELAEHLDMAAQLNQSLQQRESRLETQRQALESAMAGMLQQQARTQAQRRAIAQSLRARKAELLLECERQRQSLTVQDPPHLINEPQSTDREANSSDTCLLELQLELQELAAELTRTKQDLQETTELLQELERSQGTQSSADVSWKEASEQALTTADYDSQVATEQLSELQSRLAATESELADLREQNFDLASQVAKHQIIASGHTPHISFDSSTLTWEERKKLIMRQLEEETDESYENSCRDAADRASLRIEIENVLKITQAEIDRRDAEIAELQSIVEQQSDTRQGVAIGAAAFAQAFDSDEIIQQERQKLKELQLQWEAKLRQAEIDVSLERAKLSRERTQLEQELEATQREKAVVEVDPTQGKRRKWLEHLGLREGPK